MNRDFKILSLLLLAAVAYFGLDYYTRKTPIQNINEMVSEARKSFGKPIILNDLNYVGYKIDTLIFNEKYTEALELIDSVDISTDLKLDYQGQILFKQGKIRESINLFNQSIDLIGDFGKAVPNRANAYSKLRLYDSAIIDYKKIADINGYFNRPLAETFELMKDKDSALKYYKLYLNSYPDSTSVKNKILKLENED